MDGKIYSTNLFRELYLQDNELKSLIQGTLHSQVEKVFLSKDMLQPVQCFTKKLGSRAVDGKRFL